MRYWLMALSLIPLIALGAIYKTVDENGNTVYTDKPSADTPREEVTLPPTNTIPPAPQQDTKRSGPRELSRDNTPSNYIVNLVSPRSGTRLNATQRNVTLSVATEPDLHPNHLVQFYWNGANQGEATPNNSLTIEEIHRGEHSFRAEVVDQYGAVLGASGSVSISVFRPTRLFKPK